MYSSSGPRARFPDDQRHRVLPHAREAFAQVLGIFHIAGKQVVRLPARDRFSTSCRAGGNHYLGRVNALSTGKLHVVLCHWLSWNQVLVTSLALCRQVHQPVLVDQARLCAGCYYASLRRDVAQMHGGSQSRKVCTDHQAFRFHVFFAAARSASH
jgi:hypothetical protein